MTIETSEQMGANARAVLVALVGRIERLEDEKGEVAGQIKDVYAEAKSQGYDVKSLKTAIRRKRLDKQERDEMDSILAVYEAALYSGAEGLV